MILICFQLILIVGLPPIFGLSHVFLWFPYDFAMFPVHFHRRPSPDLWLSYDFLWFLHWFSYGFDMFPVDFNRRPSPDLQSSYDFLWFCMVFLWF